MKAEDRVILQRLLQERAPLEKKAVDHFMQKEELLYPGNRFWKAKRWVRNHVPITTLFVLSVWMGGFALGGYPFESGIMAGCAVMVFVVLPWCILAAFEVPPADWERATRARAYFNDRNYVRKLSVFPGDLHMHVVQEVLRRPTDDDAMVRAAVVWLDYEENGKMHRRGMAVWSAAH